MFGLNICIAAEYIDHHKKMQQARMDLLESLSPEERVDFLRSEAEAEKEATIERRHRELCASIEKAGKNACFW